MKHTLALLLTAVLFLAFAGCAEPAEAGPGRIPSVDPLEIDETEPSDLPAQTPDAPAEDASVTVTSRTAQRLEAEVSAAGAEIRVLLTGEGTRRLLAVCLVPQGSADAQSWRQILDTVTWAEP